MTELIATQSKGDMAGFAHIIRIRDVVVSDGVMLGRELRAPGDLLLDDTYQFPTPMISHPASFIFDGRYFRLIETNQPLLVATTKLTLMSEQAKIVVAFVLSSMSDSSQEIYIGVSQFFEPRGDYTLINVSHLAPVSSAACSLFDKGGEIHFEHQQPRHLAHAGG